MRYFGYLQSELRHKCVERLKRLHSRSTNNNVKKKKQKKPCNRKGMTTKNDRRFAFDRPSVGRPTNENYKHSLHIRNTNRSINQVNIKLLLLLSTRTMADNARRGDARERQRANTRRRPHHKRILPCVALVLVVVLL